MNRNTIFLMQRTSHLIIWTLGLKICCVNFLPQNLITALFQKTKRWRQHRKNIYFSLLFVKTKHVWFLSKVHRWSQMYEVILKVYMDWNGESEEKGSDAEGVKI